VAVDVGDTRGLDELDLMTLQVNNQLLAETIHARTQNTDICVIRRRKICGLPRVRNEGHYLDGVDVMIDGRPQVYNIPQSSKEFMFQGFSGLLRLMPPDLFTALQIHQERMKLLEFEKYLHGLGPIRFALRASDITGYPEGGWITAEYDFGLNVLIAPCDNPADWLSKMREALPTEVTRPPVKLLAGNRTPGSSNSSSNRQERKSVPSTASKPQISAVSKNPKGKKDKNTPISFIKKDGMLIPVYSKSASVLDWKADTGGSAPGPGPNDFVQGSSRPTPAIPKHKLPPGPKVESKTVILQDAEVGPFEPGLWLHNDVQSLPAADIRYMLSRALDAADPDSAKSRTGTAQKLGMNLPIQPEWAATWRNYAPLPDFHVKQGQGKNWWVEFDPNRSIPEVFRKTAGGTISPDITSGKKPCKQIPEPRKNQNGDLPAWVRRYPVFQNYWHR
jgi:hypothetical protein